MCYVFVAVLLSLLVIGLV